MKFISKPSICILVQTDPSEKIDRLSADTRSLQRICDIFESTKLRTVIQNILGGDPLHSQQVGDNENETQLARANRNNTESEHPFILSNEVMS